VAARSLELAARHATALSLPIVLASNAAIEIGADTLVTGRSLLKKTQRRSAMAQR
jgi:hypothetical protein